MKESAFIDFIGYLAGFALMASLFPQVVKSARTGKTEDLSWGMLVCTLVSGALYEIYAVLLGLTPVIIMNGTFVAATVLLVAMKLKFDGMN